jgi:hypothetical protein
MNITFVPMVQKYDKWHWRHLEAHLEAHNKAQSCFLLLHALGHFLMKMGELSDFG